MTRSDRVTLVALMVVVAAVAASALGREAPSASEREQALAAELRCPTCPGTSIADSPAPVAVAMRQIVSERVAAGSSDDDIRGYFASRYGSWILLAPPASGLGLFAYLAPGVLLVGAGVLLAAWSRRAGSSAEARSTPGRPPSRRRTVLVGALMAVALAAPLAAAVVPRAPGAEVSGTSAGSTMPAADIGALEAAVETAPDDAAALVRLGDALYAAGRIVEATQRYSQALRYEPSNVPALLGSGAILLGAGESAAARDVFERVLALDADQPDALLYRAIAGIRENGTLTADAATDLRRFVAAAPADPRVPLANDLLASEQP